MACSSAVPGSEHTISSNVAANGSSGSGWTVTVAVADWVHPCASSAVTVMTLLAGTEVKVCAMVSPWKATPSGNAQV